MVQTVLMVPEEHHEDEDEDEVDEGPLLYCIVVQLLVR